MKDKLSGNIIRYIVFSCVFLILIFFYIVFYLLNRDIIEKYEEVVIPGIYLNDYDLSNYQYQELDSLLSEKEKDILSKKIVFVSRDKNVEMSLEDMGLRIDKEKTIKKISFFQKHLTYPQKLWYINGHHSMNEFSIVFQLSDSEYQSFFSRLEKQANIAPVNGHFETNEGVKYVSGVDGFRIDPDQNKELIYRYINGNYDWDNSQIVLVGDSIASQTNERYLGIDTLASSFVTEYDPYITLRAQNLRTGVGYINGAIVEPGEVFSFYNYAGPYNKDGYVFYYEFVGNGVCQVATTTYDAALLGGHEIVTRYPHKKKSVYVDGGLDATVASANDGSWNTDMKFKNVYQYPIYIKAYDTYGEIHVEFWSHKDAKRGKTYTLESVWLGGRGYRSYRHTYQDGAEIAKDLIATTWYAED